MTASPKVEVAWIVGGATLALLGIVSLGMISSSGCDRTSQVSTSAPLQSHSANPAVVKSKSLAASRSAADTDPLMEGNVQMQSGNCRGALDAYARAIAAEPTKSKLYVLRATMYAKLGEFRSAADDLSRAIQLDPKDPEAYEQRGILLGNSGASYLALADFNKAVELNPKSVKGYINRGFVYQRLKRFDKAEADYRAASALVPKDGLPREYIGSLKYDQGQYTAALSEFNEAVRLSPGLSEIFFNRALVYEKIHENTKAIDDYDEALRLDPYSVDGYRRRGAVYALLGRTSDARRDSDKAQELEQAKGAHAATQAVDQS